MKLKALFVIVTVVMFVSVPVLLGGQPRSGSKHLSSNRGSTPRHAHNNRSRRVASRDNRRITSGIYFPPSRSRLSGNGYGYGYGGGTRVRAGRHSHAPIGRQNEAGKAGRFAKPVGPRHVLIQRDGVLQPGGNPDVFCGQEGVAAVVSADLAHPRV